MRLAVLIQTLMPPSKLLPAADTISYASRSALCNQKYSSTAKTCPGQTAEKRAAECRMLNFKLPAQRIVGAHCSSNRPGIHPFAVLCRTGTNR